MYRLLHGNGFCDIAKHWKECIATVHAYGNLGMEDIVYFAVACVCLLIIDCMR